MIFNDMYQGYFMIFNEVNMSIDWFEGKITGTSHVTHGKIDGFRIRFSLKSTH